MFSVEFIFVKHIKRQIALEADICMVASIAQQSPDALAAAKHLLIGAWSTPESAALGQERLWQRRVIGRRNHATAVKRRLQKSQDAYRERTW